MQDDRTRTFREIHGSNEALLAAVEEIERIALVKSDETSPLRLRFLEPYAQNGTSHDFILTPAHEYEESDLAEECNEYLTVSYVWTHKQLTEGTSIPDYHIWDGADLDKRPRPLRCPPIVFHRVIQFAQSRSIRRIWIDQECIDQGDASDVERHLQDMHRIYQLSRLTVAVLANVIQDYSTAARCFNFTWYGGGQNLKVLRHMIHDPWFTRSWTFHEEQCANNLVYLLSTLPSMTSELAKVAPRSVLEHGVEIERATEQEKVRQWPLPRPENGEWGQILPFYFSTHAYFG